MKSFYTVLFSTLIIGASTGCNDNNRRADLKVTNADVTGLEMRFPEVVRLQFQDGRMAWNCSGTFISAQLVLSAAHCAYKPDATRKRVEEFSFKGDDGKVHFGRIYPWDKWNPMQPLDESTGFDLALAAFIEEIQHPVAKIDLTRTYQVGEKITIVGFGMDNLDTLQGQGKKRAGTNTIAAIMDTILAIRGVKGSEQKAPPGTLVAMAPGDSGGGIFDQDGNLMGVISAGQTGEEVPGFGLKVSSWGVMFGNSKFQTFFSDVLKQIAPAQTTELPPKI